MAPENAPDKLGGNVFWFPILNAWVFINVMTHKEKNILSFKHHIFNLYRATFLYNLETYIPYIIPIC